MYAEEKFFLGINQGFRYPGRIPKAGNSDISSYTCVTCFCRGSFVRVVESGVGKTLGITDTMIKGTLDQASGKMSFKITGH